ncbi:MAG: hypothetical protein GXY70_08600 [Euryarchaeota archaeon]|nr:hypothetical protein [Euryarchaeota archaeon]
MLVITCMLTALFIPGFVSTVQAAEYTAHGTIRIDGEADLASWIANNGTGSGTESDPYVIQGLNITGSDGICIYVGNTTSHLVVRDNFLHGASSYVSEYATGAGIALFNVINTVIDSNNCTDNVEGIRLIYHSNQNTISNNTVDGNTEYGIHLNSSTDNTISNNLGNDTGDGIYLYSSGSNMLYENVLTNNTNGIHLEYSAYCTISNNTCGNNENGILLDSTKALNNLGHSVVGNNCSSNHYGILMHLGMTSTFSNNTCNDNIYGLRLDTSTNSRIVANEMIGNSFGISIDLSYDVDVLNNLCIGGISDGISLQSSHDNVISGNLLGSNMYGARLHGSPGNVLSFNDCLDCIDGLRVAYSDDNTIHGNNCSWNTNGIHVDHSSNATLYENNCTNNDYGIFVGDSSNTTVHDNNCSENGDGIRLRSSDNSSLSQNWCHGNSNSNIYLQDSNDNSVSDNDCSDSDLYGIYLVHSASNHVENNKASRNQHGILLVWEHTKDNLVANNTCAMNDEHGIFLNFYSHDNVISNNSISSNGNSGIRLGSDVNNNHVHDNDCDLNARNGLSTYSARNNNITRNSFSGNLQHGISLESSADNMVYGNTLIDNNGATSIWNLTHAQAYDDGTNSWNTTAYGNEWSDWQSPDDLEPFGIVDSPYVLAGGQDHRPLASASFNITSPPDGAFMTQPNATVSGTARSFQIVSIVWHNVADGSYGNFTVASDWSGTVPVVPGYNEITVTMTDGAGRTLSDSVTLVFDILEPFLDILSPENGSYNNNGSVTVVWTGSDEDTGIDHYAVSADGESWTNVSATQETFLLPEGTHVLLVRAYDLTGNFNESGVTVIVDMTSPSLEILSPEDGSYNSTGNVTVTWVAEDATAGIDRSEVSVDGGDWTTANGTSYALSELDEGSHTVQVRTCDLAGNFNGSSVSFTVDITAPSLEITSPENGSYNNNGSVTVVWTGSDGLSGISGYEVSLDGAAWAEAAGTQHTFELTDGVHTIHVRAHDLAGNSVGSNVTLTVDTVSPLLNILSPNDGSYNSTGNVTVAWVAEDATSGTDVCEVSCDGVNWTAVEDGQHTFELTDGVHTIHVRVYDLAGNFNVSNVTFIVDTIDPTAEITPTGENAGIGDPIMVHFSEEMDWSGLTVSVNGSLATFTIGHGNVTLIDQELDHCTEYTVIVSGADLAGNQLFLSHTFRTTCMGSIDGLLVDEQGAFMSGVTVYLGDAITTETTESGEFIFSNIPIGDYTLAVELEGYETLTAEVTVVVGHTHMGVLTLYYAGVSVIGVLINEDGDALGDVILELSGVGTQVTDGSGNFQFLNVNEGEHVLSVQADGFDTLTENVVVGEDDVDLGQLTLVASDGGNGGDDEDDNDDDGGADNTLLMIGAIVAAVIVAGVVGYVVYTKRK